MPTKPCEVSTLSSPARSSSPCSMDAARASLCVPKRHSRRNSSNWLSPLIASFEHNSNTGPNKTSCKKKLKNSRRGSLVSPHPCTPVRVRRRRKNGTFASPPTYAATSSSAVTPPAPESHATLSDEQWEDIDELLTHASPPAAPAEPTPVVNSNKKSQAIDTYLQTVMDHSQRIASALKATIDENAPASQQALLHGELNKQASRLHEKHNQVANELKQQLQAAHNTQRELEERCELLVAERDELAHMVALKSTNCTEVSTRMQQSMDEYEHDMQQLVERHDRKVASLEATIKNLKVELLDVKDACKHAEQQQQACTKSAGKRVESAIAEAVADKAFRIQTLEEAAELLECQLTDAKVEANQLQVCCQHLEQDVLTWQQRCDALAERHQFDLQEQEGHYLQQLTDVQLACEQKIREMSQADESFNQSQRRLSLSEFDELDNSLQSQIQAQEAMSEAARLKRDLAAVGELIRQSSQLKNNEHLPQLMAALGVSADGQTDLGTHLQEMLQQTQEWKDKAQHLTKETTYYTRRIVQLEKTLENIERHYMSSIVLNVKLNAIASDSAHTFRCTESVNTIFTEAKLQSIGFEAWPLWIADRLIGSNPPPHTS
eukprot:m.287474 g.287474  ORF g.287474 m.287474 type:complete len:606 (-) comp17788_c0_seq2:12724-14541(-)